MLVEEFMKEFNLIRHGEKLGVGEENLSLQESGLTETQQKKWQEAVGRLGLKKVELSYRALPKIEELAREIYDSLPEKANLIFTSTDTPRTKLTADLLSGELAGLALQSEQTGKKDIAVSFLWEQPDEAERPDGLKKILIGDIMKRMEIIRQRDFKDDELIRKYFEEDGNKTIPAEDLIVFKAFNEDLASDDSIIRPRAELLKRQYERLKGMFKYIDGPVYFYGVAHHSALVALDVAFNGRQRYNSVDDMPKPLSLWRANLKEK